MAATGTDLMTSSSRASVTSRRSSINISQADEDALQALIFDSLEDTGHNRTSGSHLKNTSSPFNSADPKKKQPPRRSSKSEQVTTPEGSTINTSKNTSKKSRRPSKEMRRSSGSASALAPHDILRMLEEKAESGNDAEAGDFLKFLKTNPRKKDMIGSEELTLGSDEFNLAVASEERKRGRRRSGGGGGLKQVEEEPSKGRISRRDRKPRSQSPKVRSKSPRGGGSASSLRKRSASPKRSLSPIPRLMGGLGFLRQATNPEAQPKVRNTVRRTVTNPEGGLEANGTAAAARATRTKRPVRKSKSVQDKESKSMQSPQEVLQMLEMCASSGDTELGGAYMQKLKETQDPSSNSDQRRRRRHHK